MAGAPPWRQSFAPQWLYNGPNFASGRIRRGGERRTARV